MTNMTTGASMATEAGASTATEEQAQSPSQSESQSESESENQSQKPTRHKLAWTDIETARAIELLAAGIEPAEIARRLLRDVEGVMGKVRRVLSGAQPCPQVAAELLEKVRGQWLQPPGASRNGRRRPANGRAIEIKQLADAIRSVREQNALMMNQNSVINDQLRRVMPMARTLVALAVCRGELAGQEAARFLDNPAEAEKLAETVAEYRRQRQTPGSEDGQ